MFHVVTGGSGSGKSAFAEQCILDCQGNKRIYIATMYPFDEESHRRIARHRAMRAEKKFTTIERYTDLEHLTIPQGISFHPFPYYKGLFLYLHPSALLSPNKYPVPVASLLWHLL